MQIVQKFVVISSGLVNIRTDFSSSFSFPIRSQRPRIGPNRQFIGFLQACTILWKAAVNHFTLLPYIFYINIVLGFIEEGHHKTLTNNTAVFLAKYTEKLGPIPPSKQYVFFPHFRFKFPQVKYFFKNIDDAWL